MIDARYHTVPTVLELVLWLLMRLASQVQSEVLRL